MRAGVQASTSLFRLEGHALDLLGDLGAQLGIELVKLANFAQQLDQALVVANSEQFRLLVDFHQPARQTQRCIRVLQLLIEIHLPGVKVARDLALLSGVVGWRRE